MCALSLTDVSVRFGGLQALSEVTFDVGGGEIVGLIGPNGAGKTTIFNVITGVYSPSNGGVTFHGQDLIGRRPHQVLAMGVARTFQNIRLFTNMTALENCMVAQHCRAKAGVVGAVLHSPGQRREERKIADAAMEALEFMGLADVADEVAQNLSYGMQRRLEIARALASHPTMILLDEPAAGMNPSESKRLMESIANILERGVAVLMVEHDMKVVMGVCQRIVVLDHGIMISQGTPEHIQNDPKVIEAYLGQ